MKKLKAILLGGAIGALGGVAQTTQQQSMPDPWKLLIGTGIGIVSGMVVKRPKDDEKQSQLELENAELRARLEALGIYLPASKEPTL